MRQEAEFGKLAQVRVKVRAMTEKVDPRYRDLDIWPVRDMVAAMYDGQVQAVAAIAPALNELAKAAQAAAERLGDCGRLVYTGAGTSGRLAVLDGAELGPTFGWPDERLVYLMAGGPEAILKAVEGAEDDREAGGEAIHTHNVDAKDVLIAVAASGKTPFTCAALEEARKQGALTIAITNSSDVPLALSADYAIIAVTGSEILAGSTRMKAGTAQKTILTMLSTAIMTRMGRVYNGLMVDMIPSNAKLRARAVRMVSTLTGCPREEAERALKLANWQIKTAVLVAKGYSLAEGHALLEACGQNLRKALEV